MSIFFSSEEFSRVRRDAKQMSAAIAISRKPVSVISGRGGTGKTEVVTTTLNAIDKFLTEKVNVGAAFKTWPVSDGRLRRTYFKFLPKRYQTDPSGES